MEMIFAYAVVRTASAEAPEVYFAEDEEVLQEVLARKVISQTPSKDFAPGSLKRIREALLDRQWGTALELWIGATDTAVDVYPFYDVFWTRDMISKDSYHLAIQNSPLFKAGNGQ